MTAVLSAVVGVLALLETPLFVVLAALTMVFLLGAEPSLLALQTLLIEMNRLATMPILVALPLFTFTGCLLTATGTPRRVMALLDALVGWIPGGPAAAALACCAFFTALTGASGITILALGGLLLPLLRRSGAGENFSMGLLTTGGSLGLLFPPSLPVILYGLVAQVPIQTLFAAALVPGLIVLAALCLFAGAHQGLGARGRAWGWDQFSGARLWAAFCDGIWDWPIAAIILVGVYGGLVTVAEVAVIVLLYVLVVACLVRREVALKSQLAAIVVESAVLAGAIIVILGFALGLTGYLVEAQIPGQLLAFLSDWTTNRYVFLAGLNLFLIVVGCLMDIFSAIVVVVPIMVPVATSFGIDPVHLGVVFLLNLEIGYATPPVGINLFLASLKFKQPVTRLYRATWPFLLVLLAVLALVTYVPQLSLWLTR